MDYSFCTKSYTRVHHFLINCVFIILVSIMIHRLFCNSSQELLFLFQLMEFISQLFFNHSMVWESSLLIKCQRILLHRNLGIHRFQDLLQIHRLNWFLVQFKVDFKMVLLISQDLFEIRIQAINSNTSKGIVKILSRPKRSTFYSFEISHYFRILYQDSIIFKFEQNAHKIYQPLFRIFAIHLCIYVLCFK